jgi:hypothetical protein
MRTHLYRSILHPILMCEAPAEGLRASNNMAEVTDYPERNTPDYLWPEQRL